MTDQYGLRQVVDGRTHFPVNPQVSGSEQYYLAPLPHHETAMVGEMVLPMPGGFGHENYNGATTTTTVEMESSIWNVGTANCRWPRQETLTLLEIRSRLDSKFKEANQKKPLWDEVSRIMAEEYGYYRSEKKCREKFENLYKYYKKTKEGRHDGKHYRFFRQLEALYGETNNRHHQNTSHQANQHNISESLSFTTNTSTASSENNDIDDLSTIAFMTRKDQKKKRVVNSYNESPRSVKKSWKSTVKDFVDSQMSKLMESQEAWMERMLEAIEDRERDKLCKEEEWRKQELARFDREHEFWAKERAWVRARDVALMEAFKKFTSSPLMTRWTEAETSNLIQLVTTQTGYSQQNIWVEIAAKMGNYRTPVECKDKWENMHIYLSGYLP